MDFIKICFLKIINSKDKLEWRLVCFGYLFDMENILIINKEFEGR